MIKINPPLSNLALTRGDGFIMVIVDTPAATARAVRSYPTAREARETAKGLNAIGPDKYPRFIGISRDSCYIEKDTTWLDWN